MALSLLLLFLAGTDILTDDPHPPAVVLAGPLATGPKGTPLYTLADRTPCTDACLQAWPPLEAGAKDKPIGDWYPYEGQWTYKKQFVYYFSGDHDASKATGDGIGNKWHVIHHLGRLPQVPSPPEAKVDKSGGSFVLTDYRGYTLYTFARDGRSPACKAECLEIWPPLLASALAQPIGEWTPVDRPDGIRQWAFRGHLLYTFSEDVTPADKNGADAGGVWKLVNVTAKDAALAAASGAGRNKPGQE